MRERLTWLLGTLGASLLGLGLGFDNTASLLLGLLLFFIGGALIYREK